MLRVLNRIEKDSSFDLKYMLVENVFKHNKKQIFRDVIMLFYLANLT